MNDDLPQALDGCLGAVKDRDDVGSPGLLDGSSQIECCGLDGRKGGLYRVDQALHLVLGHVPVLVQKHTRGNSGPDGCHGDTKGGCQEADRGRNKPRGYLQPAKGSDQEADSLSGDVQRVGQPSQRF